jgi:hypothetical protein
LILTPWLAARRARAEAETWRKACLAAQQESNEWQKRAWWSLGEAERQQSEKKSWIEIATKLGVAVEEFLDREEDPADFWKRGEPPP